MSSLNQPKPTEDPVTIRTKKTKAATSHVSATAISTTEENTMTTTNKTHTTHAHANTKENTMTTHPTSHASATHAIDAATPTATPATTPVALTVAAAPQPPTLQPVIKPPPASANIPAPPTGVTNANGAEYRTVLPQKAEQAAMPDVLEELARFEDYTAVLGKTAPPVQYVIQTLTAASEWTSMRVKTQSWALFSRTQEGAAWLATRQILEPLAPAFALAARSDQTLAQQFPALIRLFGVKKAVAKKGVVSRRANTKARAEGNDPVAGKAAKKAKRARATLAKLTPSATSAPAADSPGPTAAPVVSVAATAPTTNASNTVPNGAAH